MSRYRSLILPFLLTLASLAVLIGLGQWQLERREWKLGLMERIDARANGEPITLARAKQLWAETGEVEYYRLKLAGRFLHQYERHLYGLVGGEAGWRVLTPLEMVDGDVIFVDRGFVPEPFRAPATRPQGQIGGEVSMTALARASESGSLFTPDNQPAANRWFLRDVGALNASLPDQLAARSMPFMAEAEFMAIPGGWPRAGVTRLVLPNRHLEYALTWFGLAGTLVCVFGFFARQKLLRADPNAVDAKIADHGGSV